VSLCPGENDIISPSIWTTQGHREAEALLARQASRQRTEYVVTSILTAHQTESLEQVVRQAVRDELRNAAPPPQTHAAGGNGCRCSAVRSPRQPYPCAGGIVTMLGSFSCYRYDGGSGKYTNMAHFFLRYRNFLGVNLL
jgi:hypothetical protein